MSKNKTRKALKRSDLWDIAGFIIEIQKKNTALDNNLKYKNIDWESLEEDWFDFLEEKVFEKDK